MSVAVKLVPFAAADDGDIINIGVSVEIHGLPPHVDRPAIARALMGVLSTTRPDAAPDDFSVQVAACIGRALDKFVAERAGEQPEMAGPSVVLPPSGTVH